MHATHPEGHPHVCKNAKVASTHPRGTRLCVYKVRKKRKVRTTPPGHVV